MNASLLRSNFSPAFLKYNRCCAVFSNMDSGLNGDNGSRMDGSLLLRHDDKEAMGNPDDLLTRRLKNRERQRRYRARKRHEADLMKASDVDQSTSLHYLQMPTELLSIPVEVDFSENLTSPDCSTRVYCPRDWKKDARRVHHTHKKQELSCIDSCNSGTATPGGSSPITLDFGTKQDQLTNQSIVPNPGNGSTHGLQPSRRDWKAEARNRKNPE